MKKRLIIINRMYAGGYLTEGENIGHEIINLVRSDNGDNYLWLNAGGNCQKSIFLDKNDNMLYDEVVMLMVRMYGHRQWKILGKAEIDMSVLTDYMVPEFGEKYHEKQIKKIDEEKICYGGQPINKIFDNNFFNGKIQSGVDIYYTFKAKDVFLPISTPENVEKTIINIEGLNGISNQSLRMYLSDDKNDTYKKFNDIIDGKVFDWENENTTQKVNMDDAVITEEKEYFLKIINEEYRELSFSNLLAYFLKNKKVMALFAEQVLKLKNFNSNAYSIAREEKNIDLFISSPEHYIIIENKIRSGLIEEEKDMSKKILEYFDESNEKNLPPKAKELINAFKQVKNYYQTDRYYAYACGMVEKQKNNATISGYVLFPNYALHSITKQLQNALFSENYTPITYKQVYSFFRTLKDRNVLNASESKYLDEFLNAMEIHTKEVDNIFEEEMKNRFYKKIKSSKDDISPLR
jgi:hypothetical protein